MNTNVVVYKNRGAIVPEPRQLLKLHPGCTIIPLELIRNMEVYEFKCTFQGLEAQKWAWFWLNKKDNRARNAGSLVPVIYLRKESPITSRACKKAFKKSQKRSKPTKVKMVGGIFNTSLF